MTEKERKFGLGVLILFFNKDFSKILLLKRNEEKRKRNKADWGLVGGRVELGEKLVDSCIRECKEEIGVNLKPKDLTFIDIKENPFLTEVHHAVWFIYFAKLNEKEKIILNAESDESGWFSIEKLPERMIDSPESIRKLVQKARKI